MGDFAKILGLTLILIKRCYKGINIMLITFLHLNLESILISGSTNLLENGEQPGPRLLGGLKVPEAHAAHQPVHHLGGGALLRLFRRAHQLLDMWLKH